MVLKWSTFKIVSSDPDLHRGHFEPRSGSLNTILEVDHLRTIDDMFAILAYWFQRRRFLNIFPIGSYVKTMSAGHIFNIGPYGKNV
jgi:hypothetical protein